MDRRLLNIMTLKLISSKICYPLHWGCPHNVRVKCFFLSMTVLMEKSVPVPDLSIWVPSATAVFLTHQDLCLTPEQCNGSWGVGV